jgi:stringent starvation protein B
VSDERQTTIERLQEIMTGLMEQQLLESLQRVDAAMTKWRAGELNVFETHAELLRHAAQAERLAERMARIGLDNAGGLLRDAFDAGLIDSEEFVSIVGKQPGEVLPSPAESEMSKRLGLPGKRELIEELLSSGPILVHIDARHALAQVPDNFRSDPKLVLRFGYELSPAIIDLSIDDDGIYGTLTFGGIPCRCVLPWGCVYSVVSETDQKGMVWPEDVPDCVVDALQGSGDESEELDSEKDESGTLLSVGIDASADTGDSGIDPPPPTPPRGGHLKLVK